MSRTGTEKRRAAVRQALERLALIERELAQHPAAAHYEARKAIVRLLRKLGHRRVAEAYKRIAK